ncbi:hypothetical protein [Arthrobacter sp. NPDC056727]|uniref:hypothetical protein n=1 Tax=Arthrobacter sp. NPDC056727 TaxID=3345927 RepID=UPI003672DF75
MTSAKRLHVSIIVGRSGHPQAVIDDLWKRAVGAIGHQAVQVTGTAVFVSDGGFAVSVPDDRLRVVPLLKQGVSRLDALLAAAAVKPGPVGIAGRLMRDNVESRRLARALARRADLQQAFRDSDVVVAADLTADRSVWQLRNRTAAGLAHGPIAMLHALRETVRQ